MCDCFGKKCEHCSEIIEVHLGDFNTGREEIKAYCSLHIPEDKSDGILYEILGEKTFQVFIEYLTPTAKYWAKLDHNHTNYMNTSERILEWFGHRIETKKSCFI